MNEAAARKEWATAWLEAQTHIDFVARATGLTRIEAMNFMVWWAIDRSFAEDNKGEDWKQ